MASDKRKYTRVHHRDTVELISGTDTFSGTSVNVSKSGMRVVVKLPASHDSIRSIAFHIPGSGERVLLPCRLIRDSEHDVEGDQVLGIEFLSEADAQLLLIEKFIEDTQLGRNNARQLPRTSCHLDDVRVESHDLNLLSIDNLSTEGLLLNYRGSLKQGDTLTMSIGVPGDDRRLRLSGTVVYVIENVFRESLTAGLQLSSMKETEESRLRNLIVACSSESAMRGLHHHLDSKAIEPESRITDPGLIGNVFQSLKAECVRLSTMVDGSFTILEHEIESVDQSLRQFAIRPDRELVTSHIKPGEMAYFAFYWSKGSHYFKAEVASVRDGLLSFPLPTVVFRSNKRSYQRKPLQASRVSIRVLGERSERHTFKGSLIDISRRGFLCELHVSSESQAFFLKGKSLRYTVDERLGLGSEGQIRHLKALPSPDGVVLQIGVEAGIGRSAVRYRRIHADKWEEEKSRQDVPRGPDRRIESLFVRFPDRAGHDICAFVNATKLRLKAPVVIIPSSYGKKKEALSPLVATLLASFWSEGKDIVTLRYDGINRPGESHQDEAHPKRGYEMLSYRISQGLGDLQAALDFVRDNPYFIAEKVIIVSFSMSAIDARRLLSQEDGSGVDYWINCMGVPSAQTTLRYILGGIDIISNYRLGIPNGIIGLLGHLIDMDIMAADVVDKKYAFLTDARLDMSRIAIPVLWIYGLYDKWVDMDEVKDLMSVKARGSREILEIPTGHNLSTSDDAIQTFKLITSSIHEKLYGKRLVARDPWKEEMLRLLTEERERLQNRAAPPLTEYWRGYLIGNERNTVGYDFYRNIPEFTDFLRTQAKCLTLGDAEIIADLGCGTGLFLEELLDFISREGDKVSVREITAVDLVQDALDKTRAKCERALASNPGLGEISVRYVQKNLEPNRLIPVSRFIESGALNLDSLRNRVEGLSSKVLDRLIESASPELYAVMRGAVPEGELFSRLKSTLEPVELQTVLEFNRAARFLQNRIAERDVKPDRRPGKIPLKSLRTGDLLFERLNFGDCDSVLTLGFPENHFTKIVASLFISYLHNPDYALAECHRMLRPGGTLLVSSMKPDSDISIMFTNYIRKVQNDEGGVDGARAMLNEAASLFELEEDGFFRFYTLEELKNMLSGAGFAEITVLPSMGSPPQAHIAIAKKRLTLS
ncbi:MAG: PilZ domain-containing protein [Spirochaetia bacterium]|jgi:ubiquinone/menaquinone biosynthesis C-methylase UbiE/pimeloyl-ACP methyl ester carboxylesterase